MKRILFIHLLNDFSGSPKVLSQVISACESQGVEFDLLTSGGAGFLSRFSKNTRRIDYQWSENKFVTFFYFARAQLQLFLSVSKYPHEDLIYVNTMLPFGAALAAKMMGKKVIYHIHETSFKSSLLRFFLRFIVCKTANKVIFVSDFLRKRESFENLRQYVVHNALTSDFSEKAYSARIEKGKDTFCVLMACSLKPYKGINEFVEVAKYCLRNSNIVFRLVLNCEQERINQYFRKMQLPSNLKIMSARNDMTPFYKEASLLLNLSRVDLCIETFGLTITEAMAFGVPVIVPPIGGPVEIVTDGQEGYLISSKYPKRMAEKILWLAQNKEECSRLSANARKRSTDFNQKDFDQKIMEAICD